MADNSWFTVFTTLLGTASGAVLTNLTNFLSDKRKIKFDEAKENRTEQKRLNKKSKKIIKHLIKYYELSLDLHKKFNKKIYLEPELVNKNTLSLIENIEFSLNTIDISDDDIDDIIKIMNWKSVNISEKIFHQVNYTYSIIKNYVYKYDLLQTSNDPELFSQNQSECDEFTYKNNDLILEILRLGGKIFLLSQKNIEDIKKFLSVFLNGDNFYAKDIELNLPKIDGGFETIKRTVP